MLCNKQRAERVRLVGRDSIMGTMATEAITRITYEQFRELPEDGKRYELIHGEVHVTPAPSTKHQWVSINLSSSLGPHVAQNGLGQVFFSPLDVRLAPDLAVQPDLIFVSKARAGIILEGYIAGAPDLVVEILSPSTAAHDRATKLALYAEAGVPEVWFIDPMTVTVEILKLQGRKYFVECVLADDDIVTSNLFPGWEMPLARLFDFQSRF